MRITQIQLIAETVSHLAGTDAAVYLFGSRLNDQIKGGDIDLFIESDAELTLIDRTRIKIKLESRLGLPVDIVSKTRGAMARHFRQLPNPDHIDCKPDHGKTQRGKIASGGTIGSHSALCLLP